MSPLPTLTSLCLVDPFLRSTFGAWTDLLHPTALPQLTQFSLILSPTTFRCNPDDGFGQGKQLEGALGSVAPQLHTFVFAQGEDGFGEAASFPWTAFLSLRRLVLFPSVAKATGELVVSALSQIPSSIAHLRLEYADEDMAPVSPATKSKWDLMAASKLKLGFQSGWKSLSHLERLVIVTGADKDSKMNDQGWADLEALTIKAGCTMKSTEAEELEEGQMEWERYFDLL